MQIYLNPCLIFLISYYAIDICSNPIIKIVQNPIRPRPIMLGSIINIGEIKYKKVYQKYSAK